MGVHGKEAKWEGRGWVGVGGGKETGVEINERKLINEVSAANIYTLFKHTVQLSVSSRFI